MLDQCCFVQADVTSQGFNDMIARWKGPDGVPESLTLPTSAHANEEAAFHYAAVQTAADVVKQLASDLFVPVVCALVATLWEYHRSAAGLNG